MAFSERLEPSDPRLMEMEPLPTKIYFSAEEKGLLAALVKNEKICEDRRTSKAVNEAKAEAWERITKEYNSHSFVTKRKLNQLKRCYEKIKKLEKDRSNLDCSLDCSTSSDVKNRSIVFASQTTGDSDSEVPVERYEPIIGFESVASRNAMTEEHEKELFFMRRSILQVEKDIALENLRHQKELHRLTETMEMERLQHQRRLWEMQEHPEMEQ